MEKSLLELARNVIEASSNTEVLDAYRLALDSIHSIILIIGMDKRCIFLNQWACKVAGITAKDVSKGVSCEDIHLMNRKGTNCAMVRLENGENYTYFYWNNQDYECEASYVFNNLGHKIGIIEIIVPAGKDIRRVDLEQQLSDKSRYDQLTHLCNQDYFYERTRWLLDYHPHIDYILIYWNVKRFKVINDVFRMSTGNRVLVNISERINRLVGHDGVSGRLNDDRFAFCFPKEKFSEQWLKESANITLISDTVAYTFKSTFGIYEIEDATLSVDIMCDRAKLAQQSVGEFNLVNGKPFAYYTKEMRNAMIEEQDLISQMSLALQEHQFKTYFQPVYDIATGKIVSAEALVRWEHPEKGLIPPNKFIGLFERYGLISRLDRYVWDEVGSVLAAQIAAGEKYVPISINVSRVDFYTTTLLENIDEVATKHHLPRDLIRIEVTETAYTDDPERIIDIVEQLRHKGFAVLLDDFGSGYSSFNTLKDISINILKIDMKFLKNFETSARASCIVESIVQMASRLGLETIAEGVETTEQAQFLCNIGCNRVQGYLYSRPLPTDLFKKLLTAPPNCVLGNNRDLEPVVNIDASFNADKNVSIVFNCIISAAAFYNLREDGQLELLRSNEGYLTLMRVSDKGVLSDDFHILEYIPEEEQEKLFDALREARYKKDVISMKLHRRAYDGNLLYLNIKIRYIGNTGNLPTYYFALEEVK